jgi:hypothetical protein
VKEVLFGIRAISPLVVALILLVVCVLRQPLPDKGFIVDDADWEESEEEDEENEAAAEQDEAGSEQQQQRGGSSSCGGSEAELGRDSGSAAAAAAKDMELGAVPVGDLSCNSCLLAQQVLCGVDCANAPLWQLTDYANDGLPYFKSSEIALHGSALLDDM